MEIRSEERKRELKKKWRETLKSLEEATKACERTEGACRKVDKKLEGSKNENRSKKLLEVIRW
jgi:hypothetical protein